MLSSTDQARALDVVSGVGIAIRYCFYFLAILVLGGIGIGLVGVYGMLPQALTREPAFRLAPADIGSLSKQGEVMEVAGIRLETWHYGQLHDRGRDLTITMVTLPKGASVAKHFTPDFLNVMGLREARPTMSSVYYDLETRFGPVRAVAMRVNADGRQKLCLAFLSRFETTAAYLRGWTCEGNGSQPSAGALACTIDHMILDAPLAVPEADTFFRERAAKRGGTCGAAPVTQTTDTRPPRHSRPFRR